jgi:YggT family protein
MTIETERETVERPENLPVSPTSTSVEHTEAAAYDPYASRRGAVAKLIDAIYLLFGILEVLLLIRFLLKAFAANAQADFAAFIYGITAPFLVPFAGLFGTPQAGANVLEVHTIVALIVYALLAWVIARIIWLLVGETRSGVAAEHRASRTRIPG